MSWRNEAPRAIFRRPQPASTGFAHNTTFHRDSCSEIAFHPATGNFVAFVFGKIAIASVRINSRQKTVKNAKTYSKLLSLHPKKICVQLFDSHQALRFIIKYQ
jgi:hypothetical protein